MGGSPKRHDFDNMNSEELGPPEDEISPGALNHPDFLALNHWDSTIRFDTAEENLANDLEPSNGHSQNMTAISNSLLITYPLTDERHNCLNHSAFGDIANANTFQGLHMAVSPFDTTQVPHIALELPGMALDADPGSTTYFSVKVPPLDMGHGPRSQISLQLPRGYSDPSHPGLYASKESSEIQLVSGGLTDAPWSSHDLRVDKNIYLTPWNGGAHQPGDFFVYPGTSPPNGGHMRSSSPPYSQLHNRCSSSDVPISSRQETYADAFTPVEIGRYVIIIPRRRS